MTSFIQIFIEYELHASKWLISLEDGKSTLMKPEESKMHPECNTKNLYGQSSWLAHQNPKEALLESF